MKKNSKKEQHKLLENKSRITKVFVENYYNDKISEALKEVKQGDNKKITSLFQVFVGFTIKNTNESEEERLLKPSDPYELILKLIKIYPKIVNIKICDSNLGLQIHPLQLAASTKNIKLFKLLIENGSDINECVISGKERNLTLIGSLLNENKREILEFIFKNLKEKTYKISISELDQIVVHHKNSSNRVELIFSKLSDQLSIYEKDPNSQEFIELNKKLTIFENNINRPNINEQKLFFELLEIYNMYKSLQGGSEQIWDNEMNELESDSYVTNFVRTNWNKFRFTDCNSAAAMGFEDYKAFYPNAKRICEMVEGATILLKPNAELDLNSNGANQLYLTIQVLFKLKKLDFMNYSNKDKSIFEKAINFKCFDHLKIMLKAINNIKLKDESISLIELVIKSANSFPNLLKAFVSKHDIDKVDNSNKTLLDYAIKYDNQNSIEYLEKYKELQERLKSSQKISEPFVNKEDKFKLSIENNKREEKKEQKLIIVKEKMNKFEEIFKSLSDPLNTSSFEEKCLEKDVDIEEYKKFVISVKEQQESEIISENNIIQTWQIGNIRYSSKNMICHEHLGKKWYFAAKFDLKEQQIICLEKGFVSQSKGKNGIKLFDKSSIIEIKTSAEERGYTEHGYENSNGAILVIFDKSGNHKEVKKNAKAGNLELIKTNTVKCTSNQDLELNFLESNIDSNLLGTEVEIPEEN